MDIWPLKRIHNNIGRLIVEKIPLFILVVISCIITYKVQQIAGSMANAESLPWPARLSNALISYLSYLGKIFWPVDLALFYPYPAQLPLWKPVASALILIAVSAFVIYRFYKQPWLTTGWLWYGVSLIPVIGIVQVGSQAMADRYTYLPSIGIAMMVSWTTAELSSKWPFKRVILGILSGMIAIAMIAGTRTQITYWKDNITLYEHTLGITENNAIIHNFLGQVLLKENKIDVAFEHIAKAVEIRPNYADAHTNMGMVLASRGNPEQAILAYEQAIKLNPRCVGAYTNLATLKAQQGSLDEAVEYLRRSIQIQPTPEAYFNLGFLLKTQGNSEESISCYRNALLFKPNDIQTLWQLACCLHETGDFSEAIKVYYQVIRIEPNFPEALSRVAWILAVVPDDKLQNPTQAILLAQKACQMTEFNDPIMLDTLAVAYASANRFKEAIETSQKAVDLARAAGQVEMVQEMEKNLKLYQSGKTYQAPPSGN
jgi:tetratricopeptide (TPR) repeat protein